MLIYFYLFSLIVGFVLLGASVLLGGHGDTDADASADADAGGDVDADADADVDAHADAEGHAEAEAHGGLDKDVGGHGALGGVLTTFASLRFWTFFLAFFGLTGVVLDGLELVPSEWITLAAALAMGGGTGLGAVTLLRKLAGDTSGRAVQSKDYVGKTARVMVPFEPGSVGKVRVEIKGTAVDLLATGVDEEKFDGKDEVLIVEMDGNRARVARVDERR